MAGISVDFSYLQSIEYSRAAALYKSGGCGDSGSCGEEGNDLLEEAGGIMDNLDIGGGGLMGAETVMAILEEKVTGRIEDRFDGGSVEPNEDADYWSPEKTAQRIVDFSAKFYDAFAAASGGHSEETLDEFLGIVESAIDEGFGEARALLTEYHEGKIPKENEDVIGATRSRITELLAQLREDLLAKLSEITEMAKEDEEGITVESSLEELIAA